MREQHRANSKILGQALRVIGAHASAQRAFTLYPNVEAAAGRLIRFLTERFPGRGEPLAHECLRSAFRALAEARAAKAGGEALSFLTALVADAHEVVKKRVGVDNGHGLTFWVPFEEPFSEFLARLGERPDTAELVVLDEPAPGAINERMAAAMLAVRIMPAADADRVCESYLARRPRAAA